MPSDEPGKDLRSVFVKGVSFDCTTEDFEAAFSAVGPVRKAFLLQKKDAKRHNGSGFVQFALIEDAARAVEELNNKELHGRVIKVEPAAKRPKLADRKARQEDKKIHEPKVEPAKTLTKSSLDGKKALQTIALAGFPASQTADVAKLAALCGKVTDTDLSPSAEDIAAFRLKADGCSDSVIFATYATVKEACEAVRKLHATEMKIMSGRQEKMTRLWARQLNGEGSMVKRWRVIVRNIPFNLDGETLRKFLSGAGFVWDLTFPKTEGGTQKGFAFASFTARAHAEKAIKFANGQKLKGRVLAVDWAVSKNDFQASQQAPAIDTSKDASDLEEDASEEDSSELEMEIDSDEEKKRNVDIASNFLDRLTKDEVGKASNKRERSEESEDDDASDEPVAKKQSVQGEKEGQKVTREGKPGINSRPAQGSAAAQPSQARDRIARTVFVRNVPTNQSKMGLQAFLEMFGRIRECRLVMNPATQQPKGTAFVEYEKAEAADKAAAMCAKGRSGEGPGILMNGKQLDIDIALAQDDARTLASGRASTGPSDRRNLYLASEGTIQQQSAAWLEMSKQDQQKRLRAEQEKATKLKSPNFFISTTRLSIRNLPGSVDEKALKELLIAAVKERATKAKPKLKQVKILRDPTRLHNGEPASKGIAFAEFTDHQHALCALRQLNNNPGPFGKERRPIIEFSLENAQTVKVRARRQAGQKSASGGQEQMKQDVAKVKERREKPVKAGVSKEGSKKRSTDGVRSTVSQELDEIPKHAKKKQKPQGETVGPIRQAPRRDTQTERKRPRAKETLPAGDLKQQRRGSELQKEGPGKHALNSGERKDKLDRLVDKYRESLLNQTKSKSKGEVNQSKLGLKRWFE